jgi:glutamate--cysteine ligase
MSTRQDGGSHQPVEGRDDLVRYIEQGCKPASAWRIGTEHEKFGFHHRDCAPLAYSEPSGVSAVLEGLIRRFGWEPIMEGGNIIALKRPDGEPGGTVSLEPGGQLELSGAPLVTVHETAAEMAQHVAEVKAVGEELDVGFVGLGFSPKWSRAETPRMPKGRYGIMTAYMPKVGSLGLDMMYRSCTVQVNLDFASEADMVKKLRVSLALQPVAAAIFANSPLTEGRPNGYQSFRSAVWLDTDKARTGMLPFAFEAGMGFERYVDYALDVPMYFVYRDNRYIDASGKSFRDFLAGRLDVLPGERPDIQDWADHLSTLFPEVRMKRFLEMRGADAGSAARVSEVAALWTGLLYDQDALDAAWHLVKDWTADERQSMRDAVPTTALETRFRGGSLKDIAGKVVRIAEDGLRCRHRLDANGADETRHLAGVQRIVDTGKTDAQHLLANFVGPWRGDADAVLRKLSY